MLSVLVVITSLTDPTDIRGTHVVQIIILVPGLRGATSRIIIYYTMIPHPPRGTQTAASHMCRTLWDNIQPS